MINRFNQFGLSMIELLVALAISSFLILGITQIYIDNKKSYYFQQGQAENNDTSRFIIYTLDNELQKIGYRRRPDLKYESIFKASGDFARGEIVKVDAENKLRFRYQPHSTEDYACDGSSVSESDFSDINSIYKGVNLLPRVVTIEFDKDLGVLKCNGNEVVSNVTEFSFLYAIPVNNTNSRAGLKYVTFDDLTNANKVKGIRYRALVSSSMKSLSDIEGSKALDTFYEEADDKPDNRAIYQLVNKTVMLRNLTSW